MREGERNRRREKKEKKYKKGREKKKEDDRGVPLGQDWLSAIPLSFASQWKSRQRPGGLANRDFTAAFEKMKVVFFCLEFLGRSSANG